MRYVYTFSVTFCFCISDHCVFSTFHWRIRLLIHFLSARVLFVFAGFQPIVTMMDVGTGNTSKGGASRGLGRSFLCRGANFTSAGIGTAVKGTHPSKVGGGGGGSLHASPCSQSEDAFTSTSSFLKAVERGARNEVQVWRHSDPIIVPNLEYCWTSCSCKTDLCLPKEWGFNSASFAFIRGEFLR